MIHIHDKEVNKISEFNLIHDMINPPKCAKILNIYYHPIIHIFMNTRKGRAKFKNFQTILDSGCSSIILTVRIVENLVLKNMMWCSGIHRLEISLLILRLKQISPWPHLARRITWHGNFMCMNPIRVYMIWS